MKKIIITLSLLACNVLYTQAFMGGFKHLIDVERYDNWGKGLLTVSDTHCALFKMPDGADAYLPITWTTDQRWIFESDLIISVNGKSAKGWSPERFYAETDAITDSVNLVIRSKFVYSGNDGEEPFVVIHDFPITLRVATEMPYYAEGKQVPDLDYSALSTTSHYTNRRKSLPSSVKFEDRYDEDFDFFYVRTYDFLITGDEPLWDKQLLNSIRFPDNMIRDTKDPDILITVAKSKEESITSTYIPPTSREVNTGSTITAQYNFVTKTNDYVVRQKTQTIHEGGYTEQTKTTDIYLDISVLDARKLNDPKMTHAPVVWQMIATDHSLNVSQSATEIINALATWVSLPYMDRFCETSKEYNTYKMTYPNGIHVDPNDCKRIASVDPGSPAEQQGLRAGDIMLDVRDGYDKKFSKFIRDWFKATGWNYLMGRSWQMTIKIQRNGQTLKLAYQNPPDMEVWRGNLEPNKKTK